MCLNPILNNASTIQTITRAKQNLGQLTKYKLSEGGVDPTIAFTKECDCSGFVAWAIGYPRELPRGSGNWIDTNLIWGGGGTKTPGIFIEIQQNNCDLGDLLVYPKADQNHHGHVGIVIEVANQKPIKIIHCSYGNFAGTGDAIQITAPDLFFAGDHPTRIMTQLSGI